MQLEEHSQVSQAVQAAGMAALSHNDDLIPAAVREPMADFLSSGLQQVDRVIRGPRARFEVIFSMHFHCRQNSQGYLKLGHAGILWRAWPLACFAFLSYF